LPSRARWIYFIAWPTSSTSCAAPRSLDDVRVEIKIPDFLSLFSPRHNYNHPPSPRDCLNNIRRRLFSSAPNAVSILCKAYFLSRELSISPFSHPPFHKRGYQCHSLRGSTIFTYPLGQSTTSKITLRSPSFGPALISGPEFVHLCYYLRRCLHLHCVRCVIANYRISSFLLAAVRAAVSCSNPDTARRKPRHCAQAVWEAAPPPILFQGFPFRRSWPTRSTPTRISQPFEVDWTDALTARELATNAAAGSPRMPRPRGPSLRAPSAWKISATPLRNLSLVVAPAQHLDHGLSPYPEDNRLANLPPGPLGTLAGIAVFHATIEYFAGHTAWATPPSMIVGLSACCWAKGRYLVWRLLLLRLVVDPLGIRAAAVSSFCEVSWRTPLLTAVRRRVFPLLGEMAADEVDGALLADLVLQWTTPTTIRIDGERSGWCAATVIPHPEADPPVGSARIRRLGAWCRCPRSTRFRASGRDPSAESSRPVVHRNKRI